ncbi:hypothetical protein HKX48_008556 [Thoreauomyces humboldtii]|nr:hypothetical protein HKX48_008556 [Thoreauomyces humboldtii]
MNEDAVKDMLLPENRRALFKHFGRFHAHLSLTDRRLKHRTAYSTFTGDEALKAISLLFSCNKDVSQALFQAYTAGLLIQPVTEDGAPGNSYTSKEGGVHAVTRKGKCAAAGEFDGQVAWVDWTAGTGGEPPVAQDLAKLYARFVGGYPNEWTAEKEKQGQRNPHAVLAIDQDAYAVAGNNNSSGSLEGEGGSGTPTTGSQHGSDSGGRGNVAGTAGASPTVNAGNVHVGAPGLVSNFVVAPGIVVKDRTQQLKTHSHTFTGSEGIAHLLKHTSCITVKEALSIASAFISRGWIQCVDDPGASGRAFKESSKAVYQLTATGAQFAGWPESKTPTTKEITFFSKEGIKGRLRKIAGLGHGSGNSSNQGSANGSGTSSQGFARDFAQGDDNSLISKENLDKFEEFVKKSTEVLNSGSGSGAEISGGFSGTVSENEGTANRKQIGRRQTIAQTPANNGESSDGPFSPLAGFLNATPTSTVAADKAAGRRPRSATIGSETPSRSRQGSTVPTPSTGIVSSASRTSISSMSSTAPNFWETAKETNATRLTTILLIPILRASFQKYLATMFCQENYDFMVDVERFRVSHDALLRTLQPSEMLDSTSRDVAIVIQKEGAEKDNSRGLLLAHAVALYLKYVAKGAPFELNLPSRQQTQLRTTMEPFSTYFELFTNQLDLSQSAPIEPTSTEFRSVVKSLPDTFWESSTQTSDEVINSGMFALAEAHIFQMVAGDSVPKFGKTEPYKVMMRKLWEDGTLAKVQNVVLAGSVNGGTYAGLVYVGQPPTTQARPQSYVAEAGGESGAQYVPRTASPVTAGPAVGERASTGQPRPRPNSYIAGI